MTITREHRQECLSLAYIHAVAGACGLTWSRRNLDYGADITLHQIKYFESNLIEWTFQLDVQVKSTATLVIKDKSVRYDLPVRNYEWLRQAVAYYPRILALMLLPEVESKWISISEKQLVLRHCVYWVSLKGMRRSSNKRTMRIDVPRRNLLSVASLQRIIAEFEEENR